VETLIKKMKANMNRDVQSFLRIKPTLSLLPPNIPFITIENREPLVLQHEKENSPTSTISSPCATSNLANQALQQKNCDRAKLIHIANPQTNLIEKFYFNDIFDSTETNEQIYQKMGFRLLENCFNGCSSLILAFGGQGTGKTGLLYGCQDFGILVKFILSLLEHKDLHPEVKMKLRASNFLINSQNEFYDLFSDDSDTNEGKEDQEMNGAIELKRLKLSLKEGQLVEIADLTHCKIQNEEELVQSLLLAERNKQAYEVVVSFVSFCLCFS
jgi:hypothetical protein